MDNSQMAGLLGMNEDEVAAGFQAGIAPDQLELMRRQVAMAEGLRDTPIAQGRMMGNVYTAANPLEHLATLYSRYKGNQLADKKYGEMDARLQEAALQRQRAAIGALRGLNPGVNPGAQSPTTFHDMYGPPGGASA